MMFDMQYSQIATHSVRTLHVEIINILNLDDADADSDSKFNTILSGEFDLRHTDARNSIQP